MKIETVESRETEDMRFMQNPNNWPAWPRLPVVHKSLGIGERCGFLLGTDPVKPVVYMGNIFDETIRDITDCEKVEYPSFEKLVIEWRVD